MWQLCIYIHTFRKQALEENDNSRQRSSSSDFRFETTIVTAPIVTENLPRNCHKLPIENITNNKHHGSYLSNFGWITTKKKKRTSSLKTTWPKIVKLGRIRHIGFYQTQLASSGLNNSEWWRILGLEFLVAGEHLQCPLTGEKNEGDFWIDTRKKNG